MADNTLYYGDNLDVLRRYVKDETVDLIYLDPPFNSRQDYNVLFQEKDGHRSASQITAFEDTWEWNMESERMYEELVDRGGRVADVMLAFHTFLGGSDMMAYLAMMAPRLIELHRVLKVTGSIYLHCDPTASHYLKILMDAVFGPQNFRSELIWKRTTAHSAAKRWNGVHDTILFCTKSSSYAWNEVLIPHSVEYAARYKCRDDSGRVWADDNLTGPGVRHGDSGAVWRGFDPTARGWHWKVSLKAVEAIIGRAGAAELSTTQKLDLLDAHGQIHWPKRSSDSPGFPRFKRLLSEGTTVQDVVTDIPAINSQAQERLGYPTQKPEALLDRIIRASSNEGDLVLDPFCGCGTAISSAQRLKRRWIGIDVTHLAIGLIKTRLADAFGDSVRGTYSVIGEPTDLASAKVLAAQDRFQFQAWALGLVGARTDHSSKKGADHGVDGRLFFRDDAQAERKQIIISVKSGGVQVKDVRDLVGVVNREKAAIGVLLTLEPVTKPMQKEAVDAGFFKSENFDNKVPRIQILTIEDLLLNHASIEFPRMQTETFKQAPRAKKAKAANLQLPYDS